MRVLLFLVLFLSFQSIAVAQIEDPESIFRELRVLDGTWFMPTDRGDRLEIWRILDDNTMIGRDVRIKPENGDTILLETLRLELRDTTISYIVTARGQNNNKPVAFILTKADEDGYLFENPAHDDPKKIRYVLLGKRDLQVTTEGVRNGRITKSEFIFEREFNPTSIEFRARIGVNGYSQRKTGNFSQVEEGPDFSPAVGWELGGIAAFKGRGGFLTLNIDLSLSNKRSKAYSLFTDLSSSGVDTFLRDVTYNAYALSVAVLPEFSFRRDGRFTVIAGPYVSGILKNKAKEHRKSTPTDGDGDFKKLELGIHAGIQYKVNFGKKDLGGVLGIRTNMGLSNLDNYYEKVCNNAALCNGRLSLIGASIYYGVNLKNL